MFDCKRVASIVENLASLSEDERHYIGCALLAGSVREYGDGAAILLSEHQTTRDRTFIVVADQRSAGMLKAVMRHVLRGGNQVAQLDISIGEPTFARRTVAAANRFFNRRKS